MKKLYTSYGTYGFLNQIKINNPSHHLFQFSTADSSVIFEETEENTVLKSPSMKIIFIAQFLFRQLKTMFINLKRN